jgi:hypothetical protein
VPGGGLVDGIAYEMCGFCIFVAITMETVASKNN